MSRVCQLTGTRRMKRNKISIERSQITKRFPGFANVNLQVKAFETKEFGTLRLKISNRTMRTIEKYGGLNEFLTKFKRKGLTEEAKGMRKKLISKGFSFKKQNN